MKYLKEVLIITTVSLTGEILKYFIPLPVPASIYGLLIMLILLFSGVVKIERVKTTASFLISIMSVMFIPPAVAVISEWDNMKSMLIPLFVISTVTTVITFAVSGKVTDALLKGEDDE